MRFTSAHSSQQSSADQLAQDTKALAGAKAVNEEFSSVIGASRADLAEAEKNLAAVLVSEGVRKNCCAQVVSNIEAFVEGTCGGVRAVG